MSRYDVERIRLEAGIEQIEYYESISSTNDRALRLARETASRPWLILANRQFAGRGRGSNRWYSSDGALTFSLLLDPPQDLDNESIARLSLLTALAIRSALATFVPSSSLTVKWPNDLYLNGRKLCGILMERPAAAQGAVVVGIGINVNNDLATSPAELTGMATTLRHIVGECLDTTQVLIEVLNALTRSLANAREILASLPKLWETHCLLTGRSVTVIRDGTAITGRCVGLHHDGSLILATEMGRELVRSGVVASFDALVGGPGYA